MNFGHSIDGKGKLRSPERMSSDEDLQRLSFQKHRSQGSGGFLLQTLSSGESEISPLQNEPQMSEAAKGKRKALNGSLVVPKSRARRDPRHRQDHSLGSSPLSTEVVNAQPDTAEPAVKSSPPTKSRKTRSIRSYASSDDNANTGPLTEGESNGSQRRNVLGNDIDPAQIVNLALNLSESRRRNFSGAYLLQNDMSTSKRLTSHGQQQLGLPYSTSGGSLRQHLQQQRQSNRNSSPRSRKSSGGKVAQPSSQQQDHHRSRNTSSYLPDSTTVPGTDETLNISDASFARAEKAKEAFELLYEYRRLLEDLPAIPTVSPNTSSTSNIEQSTLLAYQKLGRAYNPLQYIRNRKVRYRERKALNAPVVGWRNLDKVRAWVDTIKADREDRITHVNGHYPLPPFGVPQDDSVMMDNSQGPNVLHSSVNPGNHLGRPYNDWTFSPWDLLADTYWLDQDDNIRRIEDHSGHKIFEQDNTHNTGSPRMSKEYARARKSASLTRGPASPERRQNEPKERKWHSKIISDPNSPIDDRGRKGRWTKGFIRSREPSTSDDSEGDKPSRLKHGHRARRDHLDNLALEKQMMDILATEEAQTRQSSKDEALSTNLETPEVPPIPNGVPKISLPLPPPGKRPQPPQRLKTDMPLERQKHSPQRASFDEQMFGHHRMSSDDFESTAPNSPLATGFIPRIAVNSSSPASPSANTNSPLKPVPSNITPPKRAPSPSIRKPTVSEHDFGAESRTSLQLSRLSTKEARESDPGRSTRSTDAGSNFLSPTKSRTSNSKPWIHESRSLRSFKDSSEPESRFRGFLKGGRIAELVGSQVSRAGDMLWRKDGGNTASVSASPQMSYTLGDSDIDDADISALDSSTNDLSRATTNNDDISNISRISTASEKPKYFMSNLPSFRSPKSRDERTPRSPKASPVIDPVSRQQRAQKERGRSSRFDQLAPPRIDMRNVSLSPSPSRAQSQSGEGEDSRDSSMNRSQSRVSSHSRLNDMLGIPGKVGTTSKRPTPTGLSGLEAKPQNTKTRPKWSISDRGVSTIAGTISRSDIARVRALLLSSGIKANEIVRRADALPDEAPKLLQGISDVIDGSLTRVPPAQEHVVAARMLIAAIESNNNRLHDEKDRFTTISAKELSGRVAAIGQRVNASLSPLVRDSADDADAFSANLTVTHTLAVKELSDRVDLILRRRRRRSRLFRRGGWTLLEWAVLGVMWMVWFIVVIVRLVRGTITGSISAVRWLFWL